MSSRRENYLKSKGLVSDGNGNLNKEIEIQEKTEFVSVEEPKQETVQEKVMETVQEKGQEQVHTKTEHNVRKPVTRKVRKEDKDVQKPKIGTITVTRDFLNKLNKIKILSSDNGYDIPDSYAGICMIGVEFYLKKSYPALYEAVFKDSGFFKLGEKEG